MGKRDISARTEVLGFDHGQPDPGTLLHLPAEHRKELQQGGGRQSVQLVEGSGDPRAHALLQEHKG